MRDSGPLDSSYDTVKLLYRGRQRASEPKTGKTIGMASSRHIIARTAPRLKSNRVSETIPQIYRSGSGATTDTLSPLRRYDKQEYAKHNTPTRYHTALTFETISGGICDLTSLGFPPLTVGETIHPNSKQPLSPRRKIETTLSRVTRQSGDDLGHLGTYPKFYALISSCENLKPLFYLGNEV